MGVLTTRPNLGGKYNDIWAGLAPISGAGAIADGGAERYKSLPMLIMHGAKDSIVSGAAQMEKVFLLFSLVSKRTTVLPQK